MSVFGECVYVFSSSISSSNNNRAQPEKHIVFAAMRNVLCSHIIQPVDSVVDIVVIIITMLKLNMQQRIAAVTTIAWKMKKGIKREIEREGEKKKIRNESRKGK